MFDWRRGMPGLAGLVAGAAAGYLVERIVVGRGTAELPDGATKGRARELTETGVAGPDSRSRTVAGPGGVALHVEHHGPDRDPITGRWTPQVVLVHGYTMSTRCWDAQISGLAGALQLVVYDQPGHGRSSPPQSSWSMELLADALATVIRQATDPEAGRLVLVGHSIGAIAILTFARRHPRLMADRVGGLLLLSTSVKPGGEEVAIGVGVQTLARMRGVIDVAARRLQTRHAGRRSRDDGQPRATNGGGHAADLSRESEDPTTAADDRRLGTVFGFSSDLMRILVRTVALTPHAAARDVELTERLFLGTRVDTALGLGPLVLRVDEEQTLAGLNVPTVVAVGNEDRLIPVVHARVMARVNPDLELVELAGVGHMTPLEAPEEVNALVRHLSGQVAGHAAEPRD